MEETSRFDMSENENRILVGGTRVVAFSYELEDSIGLIHDGLRVWKEYGAKYFASASISFSTGIEKLMKLILILDSFDQNEELPRGTLEHQWGHKLNVLFEQITERQLWYDGLALAPYGGTLETVQDDDDVKALLEILRNCSGVSRYANLDAVMRPKRTLDTPKRDFDTLLGRWLEAHPNWSDNIVDAEETAWRRIFTALQRWVRALCRILVLGRISHEGQHWQAYLRHFHSLRDSELCLIKD